MKLTIDAQKFWDKIPEQIRIKLLNNVYCVKCKGMIGIGNVTGQMDGPDLVLKGICTKCGGPVARLIEGT